jgi:hypothetical protein
MVLGDLAELRHIKWSIESDPELVAITVGHMLNLFDTFNESEFGNPAT